VTDHDGTRTKKSVLCGNVVDSRPCLGRDFINVLHQWKKARRSWKVKGSNGKQEGGGRWVKSKGGEQKDEKKNKKIDQKKSIIRPGRGPGAGRVGQHQKVESGV